MNKVLFVLGALVLSFQMASASIVAKANTWQMMGYGMDVNLTATTTPSVDQFSLIWYYENGVWKAFSKDASLLTTIHNLNLYGDNIKAGQAFWVKAKQDFSIIPHIKEYDFLPTTQGWHLINLAKSFGLNQLSANGSQMFVYRDGHWEYMYKNSEGTLISSKKLLFVNANEGFWIYNPVLLANNLIYNQSNPPSTDTLSNKSFTFDGITTTLDQNGTVISNDSKYNGGKWSGITFNEWQIVFQIVKEDKRYNFTAYKTYNSATNSYLNSFTLSSIGNSTFQTLSNGVIENLESNTTSYGSANIAMNVNDYNRSKVLHVSVKNALDTIKSIVDNGDADPRAQLSTIKTNLQALSNDNDAKVVLALVNLIEILDEDIVKNNFSINGSTLNLNSLLTNVFPQDNGAMIDLASTISNYSTNARSIMQSLSTRLKSSADTLKTIHDDENFYLPYDGKGINFADVKVLRGIILGLAFKLQYLCSYSLGSDEWFALQNESNVEFRKAEYDPVSFLNSKTFFTSPDATKLATAKALFREFVEVYYQLLNGEYYQREGMVIPGDKLTKRNLKRNLKLVMNNLDGISPKVVYINDWTEWNYQTQELTQKKENFAFDFNALFNVATAITINDFPSFAYNGVLHVSNSKIENSPVDANWMPVSFKSSTTFTTGNNINSFFKYSIDQNGVTFSGASLLNEIFNH